jgi:uncharacterized NAD-dependent epimerase/dehydratase family protein
MSQSSALREPRERGSGGLPKSYLLFLGDTTVTGYAKTAFGLRDWAGETCVGEYALAGATVSAGLPHLTPAEARSRGAEVMIIGVANSGGVIPDGWIAGLLEALEAGLDQISGMHMKLGDMPVLRSAADRLGRELIDVRTPPPGIPVGSGKPRSGRRILTVGTDCALGKKYAALAITRGLQGRGVDVDFRATGQTGIMIAGAGIPIDAVISDFIAGAAEMLSPAAPAGHVDVIEGQGSLMHPAYGAVSLGLLQGSQPDVFVVCHEPGRTEVLGHPGHAVPSIEAVIEATILMGRVTNPNIRCAGISLNTGKLSPEAAQAEIEAVAARVGLPTADPLRGGAAFERLLDACLA